MSVYMCGLIKKKGEGDGWLWRVKKEMMLECTIHEHVCNVQYMLHRKLVFFRVQELGGVRRNMELEKRQKAKSKGRGGRNRFVFIDAFLPGYFCICTFLYSYLGHYPFLINTKHPPGCRK